MSLSTDLVAIRAPFKSALYSLSIRRLIDGFDVDDWVFLPVVLHDLEVLGVPETVQEEVLHDQVEDQSQEKLDSQNALGNLGVGSEVLFSLLLRVHGYRQ